MNGNVLNIKQRHKIAINVRDIKLIGLINQPYFMSET